MPKTIVRPVREEERPRWEELVAAYATFYKTEVSKCGRDQVWSWIFDTANDFWCDLVEDSDGNVIGFTQYQAMHRSLSGTMVVYLSDLYVEPNVRGSGAGRAMIDHVIEFAKSNGYTNVRWLTQDSNYPGRRLYDTYSPKSEFILYAVPV